jgi:hypothetical protein
VVKCWCGIKILHQLFFLVHYTKYGDAEFSWQVTGVRDGFENQEVIVDVDKNGALKETRALSQNRIGMNEKVKKLIDKQTAWAKKKGLRK